MSRSKSSHRWLQEHFDDHWVKRSQQEGWRSRAVYKLEEIQEKDHIIKPGQCVVDLGAAPGGWSQWAAPIVGEQGQMLALDILEMEPLPGVTFIHGDFREAAPLEALQNALAGQTVDVVLSDMAPNISGMREVDQPRAMYLAELAADFAENHLRKGGDFLVKVFQGEGFDTFLSLLRSQYTKVLTRKPKASRPRSRELYLLARGKK
ncbi:MAG: 23S rRNA (uridine(2552)-2'-O)-methyltransferase RlmE [Xanthomonadales bacterium]|jgi:23S rRNA (uridine2552-2'-O)-methyltransferase|nr:23S rRNA (uridine(2552)-2'-O)-methyltransferase RlmE [Xanthomonadales bacterium]